MNIVAANRWNTNAEMIAEAVVPLGYIKPDDRVIDLTFGQGNWWKRYEHPGEFFGIVEDMAAVSELWDSLPGWQAAGLRVGDYTDLRRGSLDYQEQFDVVLFDPPYVSMGGRATSGMRDFMNRYGLENAETTPELLQAYNNRGLAEAWRICKPGGLVLAKCAPYISSAVRKEGDWWTRDAAVDLGFKVEDMLIHLGDVRAQPKVAKCRRCKGEGTDATGVGQCPTCKGSGQSKVRVQRHARNNYSVLFVLKKPKTRRR